mmetsp:Transcript_86409/g.222552  ORF Transcript_86409/g.222552 Transcript_86409/m.222552 type:complete len:238 (+) Transcript_86409:1627-2340(+)
MWRVGRQGRQRQANSRQDHKLVACWAPFRILLQDRLGDLLSLSAIDVGQRLWRCLDDLEDKGHEALALEGRLEREHLVQDHAQRPNVRLEAVLHVVTDLGRDVVRRANARLCLGSGVVERLGNAEIAKLHRSRLREEDVLTLQVTVQDVPRMRVLEAKRALPEDGEHSPLAEVTTTAGLPSPLDGGSQVTAIGVLHDDEELVGLKERRYVRDDVHVREAPEDLRLVLRLLALVGGQL